MHDTILDWNDELPIEEMKKAERVCANADLCICLGSTLQIMPVGGYPLLTKKNHGQIVVVNLQSTRIDANADLIIHNKLDLVFQILFANYFKLDTDLNKMSEIIEINLRSNSVGDGFNMDVSQITVECLHKPKWQPHLILLLSGKRKSGKSFLAQKLIDYLTSESDRYNLNSIALADPLKEIFAAENGLDYVRLLDSSDYKEKYRVDMIK